MTDVNRTRFNPTQLKYDEDGVPILTAAEIEEIATAVLEKHCAVVLREPRLTPVIEIIEALGKSTQLRSIVTDLGTRGNYKILGRVNFSQRVLSLDTLLMTERKVQMRFTAGHEIGHWILHRWNYENWRFPSPQAAQHDLEDTEDSFGQLKPCSSRDWIEWQANAFAAALIMPCTTVHKALVETQKSLGIKRNLGIVWLSDAAYSRRDFLDVANRLSDIYAVSRDSIRVRLKTSFFMTKLPLKRTPS